MQDHEFKLKPSRQYLALMGMVFLLSAVIVLNLPIAIYIKGVGFILVLAYASAVIWQFGLLRSHYSIVAIRRLSDGKWLIHTKGKSHAAELRGDSTVTSVVSILRFRVSSQLLPKSCVIFRDSLPEDHYRKLLVVLNQH